MKRWTACLAVACVTIAATPAAAGMDSKGQRTLAGRWAPAIGDPSRACDVADETHEFVFSGASERRLSRPSPGDPAHLVPVHVDRIVDVGQKGGLITVTYARGMTAFEVAENGHLRIVAAEGPDEDRASENLELIRCGK